MSKIRKKIKFNLRQQKKDFLIFWDLMTEYAARYWKYFVLMIIVGFVVTILQVLSMFGVAASLDVLTGREAASPTTSEGITIPANPIELSLKTIGADFQSMLGIFGDDLTPYRQLIIIVSAIFVISIIRSLLTYGSAVMGGWIAIKMGRQMQFNLFRHYMKFSLGFFNKRRAGSMVSRLESDTATAVNNLGSVVTNTTVSIGLLLIYFVLLVNTSLVLLAAVVMAGIVHYLTSTWLRKPLQLFTKKNLNLLADLKTSMVEAFQNIRVVKSFGAEEYEISKIRAKHKSLIANDFSKIKYAFLSGPINTVNRLCVTNTILLFAAYEMFYGDLPLPTCLFFVYFCQQIVRPIQDLAKSYIDVSQMAAGAAKVHQHFRMQPAIVDGKLDKRVFKDSVEVKNVSFAYNEENVLHDINLKIKKGETTALVGPSGSGKSTLVDIILRFYNPDTGSVCIDGHEIRDYRQSSYRKLFGVVSQESLLFNASIRENITYGRNGISEQQINEALEVANLTDFIAELKRGAYQTGLDTIVGDRGILMSGGQRQRLAIARAMVAKPDILVLDEATSALDSQSEREVQKAINRVTEETTAIVIAHRLSTVMHADNIVVMEKGRIVGQGRHNELMQECRLYKELVELQFNQESSA